MAIDMPKCVKAKLFDSYALPRPLAVACGPVLGCGQLWEPRDIGSIMAGVAKNHADQVPKHLIDPNLNQHSNDYVAAELFGTYDALGDGVEWKTEPFTVSEVLSHVADKDPSKARRYLSEYLQWMVSHIRVDDEKHRALIKVKVEMLKLGKPPRVITDFPSAETVLAHQFAIPLELFIKSRVSWKGLKTRDKWKPVAAIAEVFNYDVYMLFLDDVARDSNTMTSDFYGYCLLLLTAGCMRLSDDSSDLIFRVGLIGYTIVGKLLSKLMRLFSGASYTSGMNWVTSRRLWHYIRVSLGFTRLEFAAVCEGDDNAGGFQGKAFRERCPDVSDDNVQKLGQSFGKVLKIEAKGWLKPNTAWPCVGGFAVYLGDRQWRFVPSIERSIIKAGWAVCHTFDSYKVVAGRITARSWALNDRFSTVPVFWVYAHIVAGYAASLGSEPIFDTDEKFRCRDESWDGTLAFPPDTEDRLAFEVVTGVGPGDQLLAESYLLRVLRAKDWHADLSDFVEELFA